MTQTLSQVVGKERHLRKKDNEVGSALKKQLQAPSQVTGSTKTFKPKNDELPPEQYGREEYQEVALTVRDALAESARYASEVLDSVATKDKTNQSANADLVVDGRTVLKDVPISHLLWLEDYLTEWRSLTTVLPLLNPALRWTEDEGRQGLYRSAVEVTDRTIPDKVPVVLYPATDKHPAQVQLVDKPVFTGTFEKQILSGAITADRKKKLIDNVDKLIVATRDAIQRANRTEAVEVAEGQVLTSLLLA